MDPEQLAAKLRSLTAPFTTGQLVTLAVTFVLVDRHRDRVGHVAEEAHLPAAPVRHRSRDDGAGRHAPQEPEGAVPARRGRPRHPRARQPRRRAAARVRRAAAAGVGLPGWKLFDGRPSAPPSSSRRSTTAARIEGEMARTIATLSEVSSARVHIAMGKETLFGESRPATASVVLKLQAGRSLPASAVNGITNLVAGERRRAEGRSGGRPRQLRPAADAARRRRERPGRRRVDGAAAAARARVRGSASSRCSSRSSAPIACASTSR